MTFFIGGLVLGFAPTVLHVLLYALFPPFTRVSDDPAVLAAMRWVAHAFLIVMPVITAYAVRAGDAPVTDVSAGSVEIRGHVILTVTMK